MIIFLKTDAFSPSLENITPGQSINFTFLSKEISYKFLVNPGTLDTPTAFDFFKLDKKKNKKKKIAK